MKKSKLFLNVLILTLVSNASYAQVVKEVKVGTQIWMEENLTVSTFRNGDTIPQAKTEKEWETATNQKKPVWCYYDNDTSLNNNSKFGKLYNWYAVCDPRGLAPLGWHVPASSEWEAILVNLGGVRSVNGRFLDCGQKIKSSTDWFIESKAVVKPGTKVTPSLFKGYPVGVRTWDGKFEGKSFRTYWWCLDERDWREGYIIQADYSSSMVVKWSIDKGYGISVRCVKD